MFKYNHFRALNFQMPSTRKQKATKKRSRQLDVMSDLENTGIILGNYSRNELDCQSGERETGGDLESNGQLIQPVEISDI